jgi:hypothetical protein
LEDARACEHRNKGAGSGRLRHGAPQLSGELYRIVERSLVMRKFFCIFASVICGAAALAMLDASPAAAGRGVIVKSKNGNGNGK